MANYTVVGRVRDYCLIASFVVVAASSSFGGLGNGDGPRSRVAPDPNVASGCIVQAAAYAAAVSDLEDAQQADDAYADWVDCQENAMTPDISADSGTVSILVRD